MIVPNSRYANSNITTVMKDGADVAVIVPSAASTYSFAFVNYQVAVGDRIDTLAFRFYGDATQWWRIAQANPEIMFWDNIAVGSIVRVPQL